MPAKPASIAAVAASRTSAHRAPKGSRSRSTFMDRPAPYVFVPEIMPLKPLERWAAVGPQDVAKRWQSTTVAEHNSASQSPFRLQLRPQFGVLRAVRRTGRLATTHACDLAFCGDAAPCRASRAADLVLRLAREHAAVPDHRVGVDGGHAEEFHVLAERQVVDGCSLQLLHERASGVS